MTDVVLAYRSTAVFADPERVDLAGWNQPSLAVDERPRPGERGHGLVEIPVLYDGPDLDAVAARLGLAADVVPCTPASYDVFAIGFLRASLRGLSPRRP